MTILKYFRIVVTFFLLISFYNTSAQDLRDFTHTLQFADYLFKTQQYTLASEEYERAVYYDSTNSSALLKLIKAYRFDNKHDIVAQKFDYYFKDSINYLRRDFAQEYINNLLYQNKFEQIYNYLDINNSIEPGHKQSLQLASILLQKDWDKAFTYALKNAVTNDKKNADLHVIAFRSKQLKYKKPFVAALFSTIIPGTGKMYTKNWKDGIISLLFVGVNSWQAYRGFHKYGNNSAYGWVFAGFATSFYIGNIFGSHKSAKKYNEKIDNELYHETWHLMVDDL